MPNTPALVSVGASAVALGQRTVPEDSALITKMFSSVGIVVNCTEKDLNAVTGLSGSGPAFVFMFIESLADGGVRAGLPRAVSLKLATQTVLGAATLVKQSGLHPGALKDQVASPGGTTIAGVHALENGGFRSASMTAVYAAANRAAELGAPSSDMKKSKL
jgi:pyrroline-5-carboxylate reductase